MLTESCILYSFLCFLSRKLSSKCLVSLPFATVYRYAFGLCKHAASNTPTISFSSLTLQTHKLHSCRIPFSFMHFPFSSELNRKGGGGDCHNIFPLPTRFCFPYLCFLSRYLFLPLPVFSFMHFSLFF